jgi:hypothetical protein
VSSVSTTAKILRSRISSDAIRVQCKHILLYTHLYVFACVCVLVCVLASVYMRMENYYNVDCWILSVTCCYVVAGSVPLFKGGRGNPILMPHTCRTSS